MSDIFRQLPSVDQILQLPSTLALLEQYRREFVADAVRQLIQRVRACPNMLGESPSRAGVLSWVEAQLAKAIVDEAESSLRRVINASGVILHTGLGRAPLPSEALDAVRDAATYYCNLELDLVSGQRGSRISHVSDLVCQAAGSEAATVVNNNAAAVLLMLNTLARDREVIVSRGELVEIGGSFRVPDIIAASGARIREVGTTNRTHLSDYADAVSTDTALILLVHPSNYRIQGFTSRPQLEELVALTRKVELPLIYDMGGGVLSDLADWELPHEPVVEKSLSSGVDLVSFSGDKVLGGPQAGIIAGRRRHIEPIMRNPLMRTLRCDKLILAALEACLRLYRRTPERLKAAHPVLRMLTASVDDVERRANSLMKQLSIDTIARYCPVVEESLAQAGSGTLPMEEFPSRALVFVPDGGAEEFARCLRLCRPAILGRIHQERFLIDMRTVADDEVGLVAAALNDLAASLSV